MLTKEQVTEYMTVNVKHISPKDRPIIVRKSIINFDEKTNKTGKRFITTITRWEITFVSGQNGRVGISLCNPDDPTDKKVGNYLALARVLDVTETKGVITFKKVKKYTYKEFDEFCENLIVLPIKMLRTLFNLY